MKCREERFGSVAAALGLGVVVVVEAEVEVVVVEVAGEAGRADFFVGEEEADLDGDLVGEDDSECER